MISMDNKYKTRNGCEVRLYAAHDRGLKPVHGASFEDGEWRSHTWTADGRAFTIGESELDLIEVKEKRVVDGWLNVYPDDDAYFYFTKEEADNGASDDRIACLHIRQKYEEGEGL